MGAGSCYKPVSSFTPLPTDPTNLWLPGVPQPQVQVFLEGQSRMLCGQVKWQPEACWVLMPPLKYGLEGRVLA